MKRRHRVNRELLLPTQGSAQRRGLKTGLAIMTTLGLTGALAIPIMAQDVEERRGNIPIAIDAINDPSFFTGDVYVDEHAPLAVFAASGKKVAIDGRPSGMLEGASAEEEENSASPNSSLLAGQVGELGVLPGDLQLMHPVTTRRISSAYGWRKNPTGPGNQIHIGQDYALACGLPVYAAEAGRVINSGWHGHSGNRVTLDHGNNVQTGYSHNSKLLVKIGDEVKQGELLALVGTTGNSTGCHLHFEVIINGRWHDPRNYLPAIPGQPNAMVDSRRLTVKSYTAPEGNGGNQSANPQPSQDPDVVTPEDDTPVVPKPKPSPTPPPTSASPTPTPPPTSASPTPTQKPPTRPSPSTNPTAPNPTDEEPIEEDISPSPSESFEPEPTETTAPPETEGSSASPSTEESPEATSTQSSESPSPVDDLDATTSSSPSVAPTRSSAPASVRNTPPTPAPTTVAGT